MDNPYLIADETFLSNKEARAYVLWHDGRTAESIATELGVAETTAWTYKYRINSKLARAKRTVSLKHKNDAGKWVDMMHAPTIVDETFFNTNIGGNDRGASRDRAIDMVTAHVMNEREELTMQEIARDLGRSVDDVDLLLGEATAIASRAEKTSKRLDPIPAR